MWSRRRRETVNLVPYRFTDCLLWKEWRFFRSAFDQVVVYSWTDIPLRLITITAMEPVPHQSDLSGDAHSPGNEVTIAVSLNGSLLLGNYLRKCKMDSDPIIYLR